MKVIFIADAHLKGLDDLNQKRLCTFLDGLGPLDKLVILGDLLEFWSGIKGVVYYHYFPVLAGLFTLREKGTDIIYVEGNHDFSMGPFFTDVLGAEVHAEPFEFLLDGKRFLLAHGDTVDSSIGHAIWRDFIRRFLQMVLTRTLTAAAVRRFALFLSKSSRAYNEARGKSIEMRQRAFLREDASQAVSTA
jgi:UDP-2,3-diacylglucosamine hydrolase